MNNYTAQTKLISALVWGFFAIGIGLLFAALVCGFEQHNRAGIILVAIGIPYIAAAMIINTGEQA